MRRGSLGYFCLFASLAERAGEKKMFIWTVRGVCVCVWMEDCYRIKRYVQCWVTKLHCARRCEGCIVNIKRCASVRVVIYTCNYK